MIKYILFDVSGTLLYKPTLYWKIQDALSKFNYNISINEIESKHKIISEIILFPDVTDELFYEFFNSELLLSLGIIPTPNLLRQVFDNCTYQPWKEFDDTKILSELLLPIGIISNFNNTLRVKLNEFFGPIFSEIVISEEIGVQKPNRELYEMALDKIPFKAEEILYVGDSLKLDIIPAQSVGMNTLLIDRLGLFRHTHTARVESLLDLRMYL